MPLVIGSVPYLNAEPLTAALRDPSLFPGIDLREEVPSRLLESLRAGRVSAALVSVAGVFPDAELCLLPGYCVASRERVLSIHLYLARPLAEVRTVALDASSRSSVAMVRVLFAERYGSRPEFVTHEPDLRAMLAEADAALLIGNPALRANRALDAGDWHGPPVERLDLGAEWWAETGLPFVYAAWAVRADAPLGDLPATLARAAEWGLPRARELAMAGAAVIGIDAATAVEYLTRVIRHRMGEAEIAGMERFLALGVRHEVLPAGSALRWAMAPRAALATR